MTTTPDEVRERIGPLALQALLRMGYAVMPMEPDVKMMIAAKDALTDSTVEEPKAAAWDSMRAYRAMVEAGRVKP